MTLNIVRILDRTGDLKTFHKNAVEHYKKNKEVASRGKSTKGWFYGFKLQGVCTENGTFRPGSEHDSKAFDDMTKEMQGIFVTDAGYLLKKEELRKMHESRRKPCTAARKNMKRLMTKEQFSNLRKRNRIENVWSVMKLNYNLIYHRAGSIVGMFRHFFYSNQGILAFKNLVIGFENSTEKITNGKNKTSCSSLHRNIMLCSCISDLRQKWYVG